jgi:hypothetical protein
MGKDLWAVVLFVCVGGGGLGHNTRNPPTTSHTNPPFRNNQPLTTNTQG